MSKASYSKKKTTKTKKVVSKKNSTKKKVIQRNSKKKALRKNTKRSVISRVAVKKKGSVRNKSQSSVSIRALKSKSQKKEELYTVYLAASGGSVVESHPYLHRSTPQGTNPTEKNRADVSFGTVERIPQTQEDEPSINSAYSNDMLTDHLMNYFIQSSGALQKKDSQKTSKNLDPESVHVESLDLEIRNNLSDIVMALLKREERDRLYNYLVEYEEFIRDIMNILK